MEIFVRKYTEKQRFKPHYNSSMGKYYGTSKEFMADLDKKGLQLVKDIPESHSPKRKAYKPSKWAEGMVESIKSGKQKDGSVKLGDRFYDSLKKRQEK